MGALWYSSGEKCPGRTFSPAMGVAHSCRAASSQVMGGFAVCCAASSVPASMTRDSTNISQRPSSLLGYILRYDAAISTASRRPIMKRLAASLLLVTAIFIGFTIVSGRRPAAAARGRRRLHCRAGAGRPSRLCAAVCGCHGQDFRGSARRAIAPGRRLPRQVGPARGQRAFHVPSSRRCLRRIRARSVRKAHSE